MMMSDKITFSAWHDNEGGYGVNVVIENEDFTILYRGDMSMEVFAKAITQSGYSRITRQIYAPKDGE